MSLFLSTSSLQNHYQDCCNLNVNDTIERDCLSVLHKLHDQVNGLQLVQVVVQPLARLFNPASMAALASASNTTSSLSASSTISTTSNQQATNPSLGSSINLNNPSSLHSHHHHHHSNNAAISSNSSSINPNNDLDDMYSANNTYMMSPDTAQALIARLDTDRDVNWLMEIIGYGLSMPFSLTGEQDSVKDCCTIYLEWLSSSLLPFNEQNDDIKYKQLSKLVPIPIRNDPNYYARKILSHLYNVFLPRPPPMSQTAQSSSGNQKDSISDSTLAALSRQAVLCHRVLRTLESTAQNPNNLMDNETWNHLLALLLTINNKLLSPPTQSDIGTQLQDRILGVLFDLMLFSSAKNIPSPGLWKTFHEMCLDWRHRPALIEHWKRVTMMLTKKIVQISASTPKSSARNRASLIINSSADSLEAATQGSPIGAIESVLSTMNYDNLSQTWYRFLSLIGNPIELTNPSIMSKIDESSTVIDSQQSCINVLPQIFYNTMLGLKDLIEAFLGNYESPSNTNGDDRHSLDPFSSDRYVSKRGSVVSIGSGVAVSPPIQQVPSSGQGGQPFASGSISGNQSQVATPTQARKVIKSITMKGNKVLTFNPSSSGGGITQSIDHSQIGQSEHPKSGSITNSSRFNEFIQPRPSLTSLSSRTSQQTAIQQQNLQHPKFILSPDRPKCNSILHLFGDWLFSAALIGSDLNQAIKINTFGTIFKSDDKMSQQAQNLRSSSTGFVRDQSSKVSSQVNLAPKNLHAQQSQRQSPSNPTREESVLSVDSFEAGQSEAMAILCKIFSSKCTSEDISPNYLSRFYLCLQHCLTSASVANQRPSQQDAIKRHLLSSVLINSTSLLSKDLDGINLLIPSIIGAIESIFECSEREAPIQAPPRQHNRTGSIRYPIVAPTNSCELRRACISTLLNLLAYPYHFQELAIRSCLNDSSPTITFASLRPRLLKLLFIALQTENDPMNMQILFGGLSLATNDLASDTESMASHHSPKDEVSRSRQLRSKQDPAQQSSNDSFTSGFESSDSNQDKVGGDSASQKSFVFSSNEAFIVKALHVTCHQLINVWKNDTQVSLAALELLTMIARITGTFGFINHDNQRKISMQANENSNSHQLEMRNEYNQATKWICDYICSQCSRPPPAHSRDMHSTIVAAYQCLSVWISNHSYLLNDEGCVNTLMEVIELGVSGQKSKSIGLDTGVRSIISKSDKVSKPSSKRVKEAAEALLNICMTQSKQSIGPIEQAQFQDVLISEIDLVRLFSGSDVQAKIESLPDREIERFEAHKQFRYFCDEDSIIYGLLEGNQAIPASRDTVVCLLRTPFGRSCCRFKFSYYSEASKEKVMANKTRGLIKRPFSHVGPAIDRRSFSFAGGHNKSLYFNNTARFFPETIENLVPDELDKLDDTLDDYVKSPSQFKNPKFKSDCDMISKIFSHQVLAEQNVMSEALGYSPKRFDCEEPQPSPTMDAVRMLVAHLGFKTALSSTSIDGEISRSFVDELRALDGHPVRICDLVSIFYVRKNRTSPNEILESVRERRSISLAFFEWLFEIGHPVSVRDHPYHWAGKLSGFPGPSRFATGGRASIDPQPTVDQLLTSEHGGSVFDCQQLVLHWTDSCQELAFMLPNRVEKSSVLPNKVAALQTQTDCDAVFINSPSNMDAISSSEGSQIRLKDPNHDHSSDGQSMCSVTSDTSSQHSNRAASVHSSPRGACHGSSRDARDNISRQSYITQKKKSISSAGGHSGCDTNFIICWLESADDLPDVPTEALLNLVEPGFLFEEDLDNQSQTEQIPTSRPASSARSRDYAKYFICPLKNGLYRVHLQTSFGRHNLALPLVDGTTVSKKTLGSLVRESILNLCRRRRLDADCYQPPHVRRRLKILDICNSYKISSRYESAEYHSNLFRSRAA